ncbi:MAG: glycosyltransferase family 2 protein [Methanomicrobiales archaeon]|nr:glycosyltransferase family 2 protein [Methanomicrobiales archaeon]
MTPNTAETTTGNTIPNMSLVIPAYNEERRITLFFDSIRQFDGELIVVCDGTDRTAEIVDAIAARRADLVIRCLRFDHRLGKGGGVLAGLREAQAPLVGYVDADGSTSMEEMLRLFASLRGADGAIGSRWVDGATMTVKQSVMRQVESRGFNLLIRLLFGLTYHDTQCGAKVFSKQAADAVLPLMVARGFEFDVELLWRMKNAGFSVIEVPIEWQNKGDSRVQKRDMIRMLAGLVRVRFCKSRA